MAFEIVDGMTGTKHISSDDLAALNIATVGKADCVLGYGEDFKLTMASSASATLGTGVGMVGGRRFWSASQVSLDIQPGEQGRKRNDLVVARYSTTSEGIEGIQPVVIGGTPTTGTPADPDTTSDDLKLWRIPLDGISIGEPVRLFDPVIPLAALGDSVSQDTGWVYLYNDSKWGYVRYRAKAGVCSIQVGVYGIDANANWKVPAAIPTRFLPDSGSYSALAHRQSNNVAQLWIPPKTSSDQHLYIYSQVSATAETIINGFVSYLY